MSERENIQGRKTRLVRFYSHSASCGYSGNETPDDYHYIPVDEEFLTGIAEPIIHRVVGNSMMPRFYDGMLVIVETSKQVILDTLQSGKIIVANVNGTTYCKEYQIQQNDQTWLFSSNKQYEDMYISRTDKFIIVGIVKKCLVDVD